MDIQANQVSSAVSRRKVRALLLGDRIDTSPAPITTREIEHDRGPVLVTVEYRIDPKDRNAFLAHLNELARERRRDGAYRWRVFEDAAEEGRFVETFLVGSSVLNDANETIGKIDDLLVTRDGKEPYAVLSIGGFLGMGTHLVVVRYDSLKFADNKIVLPGGTKDGLKMLPTFQYAKE
jgi:Transmembrane secretion effector/PRC-barrel domain